MQLTGKVVVVTGAASGIGLATANAFAREGARVHLVDLARERVDAAALELRNAGLEATAHVADLTDFAQVQQLADRIFDLEGRVDVLHNNAGVGHGAPIERTDLDDWKWVLDTNLWTVIHGIHAFSPRMRSQGGGGHIVNTASAAGLFGIPGMAPYCTSKFAVMGLSEALGAELAREGIYVTAICPGLIKTRIVMDGRIDVGPEKERIQAVYDRFGSSPEQVAADVLHAVRRKRAVQLSPGNVWAPWLLKRVSSPLYQWAAQKLAARILR